MRKCDKKRLKLIREREKLSKAQRAYEKAFVSFVSFVSSHPETTKLEQDHVILQAVSTLGLGHLKVVANNPERFSHIAHVAATILSERLFQLKQ